jgi:FHS family L-fucose permease-like MFS transporter
MSESSSAAKPGGGGLVLAVIYVTALFFIWAFVTNLVDPLIRAVGKIYTLNNVESNLTQFAFFIAYGVMSIPSAWVLSKFGYAKSIVIGLVGIIVGCAIAYSTRFTNVYETILVGLFVAASGITLLQVAANPLIASMGDMKGSHFRLNLSQSFNSLGAFVGGFFGSTYMFKGPLFESGAQVTDALKTDGLGYITNIYLGIACILAVFTLAVFLVRNTIAAHSPQTVEHAPSPFKAFTSKWANLGSIGIFLYVGAEVCVISNLIAFLEQQQILNVPTPIAGKIMPFFMLAAMVGRFSGSALLRFVKGTTLLSVFAIGASVLCLTVILTKDMHATALGGSVNFFGHDTLITSGFIPGFAAVLIGLFNSIMFPTIFTLTLERSTAPASATSGLMCMAICGGGFVSLLFAWTIDHFTKTDAFSARSLAFIVPLACYLFVLWFALAAKKAPVHAIEEGVSGGH